jgi:hypothetical protein
MKLIVPFIYKAQVALELGQNLTYIYIKDEVEVEIEEKTLSDFPLAIKVSEVKSHPWGAERNLHWDGKQLWSFKYEWHFMKPLRKIHIDEVISKTDNDNVVNTYQFQGDSAPFNVFWYRLFPDTEPCDIPMLWHDNVTTKENATYAKWYGDDKAKLVGMANKIASKLKILNGYLFEPVAEPQYQVKTDHKQYNGRVKIFVELFGMREGQPTKLFNAMEFNQAQAFADKLAIERGEPTPAPSHRTQGITVLMPEVIQHPPTVGLADKDIKAFQVTLDTFKLKNTPLALTVVN